MKNRLGSYFENYTNPSYYNADKIRVEDIKINSEDSTFSIYTNEAFLGQPFSRKLVTDIYSKVQTLLPDAYKRWKLTIYANGTAIEHLVPIWEQEVRDSLRTWEGLDYKGNPWVKRISIPYSINKGLQNRHIALWASHGKYYRNNTDEWSWQRPRLYTTTEDLFTQTIVVPFLMPMLEGAGAILFSPRERDWQKNEAIVDNNRSCDHEGSYIEENGRHHWEDAGVGFSHLRLTYRDKQNPFEDGTARMAEAQSDDDHLSKIYWTPEIPESGDYAVYVSYKTLPESVSNATYTIVHGGVKTDIQVNQKMGGGTWVYLGTFSFDKGTNPSNCVILTNESSERGIVTADAVRFGGGMGNILRGDSLGIKVSGSQLPRYLEGARYSMQWSGMPYRIYGTKNSENDYGEDINARSLGTNHIARGSIFMPNDTLPGLGVPVELSLALHSDAGYRKNQGIIGTLGIYTTGFYEGRLATGLNRLVSRDFAEMMLKTVREDMQGKFGSWTRRQIYDRNYSESREPQVPSMILEMLSHQNYADLKIGLDPYCKFILARAIYKGILKYEAVMHNWETTVTEPLPIQDLCAVAKPAAREIIISWNPQVDDQDETASPTSYVLYTRRGNGGWDNGMLISDTKAFMRATPGELYRFKVAAVNAGGSSMMSEEVCARVATEQDAPSVAIVNAFTRLASPQPIDNDSCRGFDMRIDPGVAYHYNPGICGYQIYFNKKGFNREDKNGLGYSGRTLEGTLVAGNTFDYTSLHALDLLSTDSDGIAHKDLSISSLMSSALNEVNLTDFSMVDVIMGAQREDGYSHGVYQTFTKQMRTGLENYAKAGGRILVSGAYIGEDLKTPDSQNFAHNILKYDYNSDICTDSTLVKGMGTECFLYSQPNERMFSTARVNALQPVGDAFCTMLYNYKNSEQDGVSEASAAVAYKGNDYRTISFGFPLEMVTDASVRRSILNACLKFLVE